MTSQDVSVPSFKSLMALDDLRIKIVDIGAALDDYGPLYQDVLKAGDADLVGFEPSREALAQLNAAKGPNETYLPHAVGDGRRHILSYCADPGMHSLLTPNQPVLRIFSDFSLYGTITGKEPVDTVRLDDVPETSGADLIKIDIQGGELMALAHGEARVRDALVVHTEVEFISMYEKQPLFSEVELLLRNFGFMFHRFFQLSSRVAHPLAAGVSPATPFSQVMWGDALFIRDLTVIDRLSDVQILKMAMILHDLYRSVDIVAFLLDSHDRRKGSQLTSRYLRALTALPNVPWQSLCAPIHR